MSHDEEMAAVGQMATDYAEAKRQKIILLSETKRIGDLIKTVGICMQHERPEPTSIREEHLAALDAAKVKSLVTEVIAINDTIDTLAVNLAALGLPTK